MIGGSFCLIGGKFADHGRRVEPEMDLESLVAIDVHTHAEVSSRGGASLDDTLNEASAAYFKVDAAHRQPTLEQIAAYYRERDMMAVVFTVDAEHATGIPPVPNEEVAEAAAASGGVLIPFASIDPFRGKAGVAQARALAERYGVKGFKFHPNQTGIGAGVPGGGGIRLKYSNPLYIDDVAADFPGLKIILAHPSFPWQDEALSIATHKPGVYIDLSGWSPRYFPPQLVQYANTLLQDKVLFGSDFPLLTPDRWLADFAGLPIKDEVRPKILKLNAARLLGLPPADGA